MSEMLTIALSKGRIFKETLPLLKCAGIELPDGTDMMRKLILDTNQPNVKLLIVRASDVPTYVEYGAADVGIAGKDVLLEHGGEGLYELIDLEIARCRLMVAGLLHQPEPRRRLQIATKFVNSTRHYYASRGEQVEIIKLYGSMELAPLVGLADRIVDLVDTGSTLKANGLVPLEHITDISARLVVNRAALKVKHRSIQPLIDHIAEAVVGRRATQA